MFKLTVIGAVMVAATSAAVFQDKMALKNLASNATAPPCPKELLEEYENALDAANVTTPEEYLEEVSDYLSEQAEIEKDALVDSLLDCYDVDGDGYLSREEFDTYVVDSLIGREGHCPSFNATEVTPLSMAISSSQMSTLLSWTSGRRISQIYSATPGRFFKSQWKNAIAGRSNLVFVGKTYSGAVVGGYTGNVAMPTVETSQWLSSTNMFVFNLKNNGKWTSSYSSSNIWINTYSSYTDLIDFGWHNALQFEASNTIPTVSYTKSSDFLSDPTNTNIGVLTSDMQLTSFEVYQITF